MGTRRAEIVVRPEGLVERPDEVEEGLPAARVAQWVLAILTALSQPVNGGQKQQIMEEWKGWWLGKTWV